MSANKKILLICRSHNKQISNIPGLMNEEFQVVFSEGVDTRSLNNVKEVLILLIKDPVLTIFSFFLFNLFYRVVFFIKPNAVDVHKIIKDKNVPSYLDIDVKIADMIDYFSKVKYLFYLVFVAIFYFWGLTFYNLYFHGIILGSIYFFVMIRLTANLREIKMCENLLRIMQEKGYTSALFYCGPEHEKGVKKIFEKNSVEVKVIR